MNELVFIAVALLNLKQKILKKKKKKKKKKKINIFRLLLFLQLEVLLANYDFKSV